ncbi:transposase [Streptomyces sp. NPDC059688]|uniref:transposase n=1 Tax=Streptomyces sp. NPDC059688 TaxID=3346906 RepID=UPI0036A60AE2
MISDHLRPRRRRRIRARRARVTRTPTSHWGYHALPRPALRKRRKQLAEVLSRCWELAAAHRLVRSLSALVTTRTGQRLKDWVVSTRAAELPGLHSCTPGLEKDWDAVVQGLTSHWNSGPVEGRVDHIKMVRRRMFGRAKLPLLRKRILFAAARCLLRQDEAVGVRTPTASRVLEQPRW